MRQTKESESEVIARLKRNLAGQNATHKQERAAGRQAVAAEQQQKQQLEAKLAVEQTERQRLQGLMNGLQADRIAHDAGHQKRMAALESEFAEALLSEKGVR